MNQILFIKTSLNDVESNSNKLASDLVATIKQKSNANIVVRDVAKQQLPHLTQAEMESWMVSQEKRSNEQEQLTKISDSLINELEKSDVIVVAMPMYNFGVPSTFKVWVDRIARAGVTFNYTENGPVGLVKSKKVIIVTTRGGLHKDTEKDSQTQFLKDFFSLIGLDDINFIYAEGLNTPDKQVNLAEARTEILNFEV